MITASYIALNYMLKTNPYPVKKVHGANMGPTWVLSAPDGPHVGPMDLAIRLQSWWLKAPLEQDCVGCIEGCKILIKSLKHI